MVKLKRKMKAVTMFKWIVELFWKWNEITVWLVNLTWATFIIWNDVYQKMLLFKVEVEKQTFQLQLKDGNQSCRWVYPKKITIVKFT